MVLGQEKAEKENGNSGTYGMNFSYYIGRKREHENFNNFPWGRMARYG